MILLIHILVAVSSLGVTGYAFLAPSKLKLRVSYALVALTLASGTYLVLSTNARMVQACLSGLAYLGFVSAGIAAARLRLAKAGALAQDI